MLNLPLKLHLTTAIVNAAIPPENGEAWIADTVVKGFGLRLVMGKNGGGRNFGLRVRNRNGKSVRETFNPHSNASEWWIRRKLALSFGDAGEQEITTGDFVDAARRWAKDRIIQLKGGYSYSDRCNLRWERAAERVQAMTFGEMAQRIDYWLEKQGRRFDFGKFTDNFNAEIQNTLLTDIQTKSLADEIANPANSLSHARALRRFVRRLFAKSGRWFAPLRWIGEDVDDQVKLRLAERQMRLHSNEKVFSLADFHRLFDILESEAAPKILSYK